MASGLMIADAKQTEGSSLSVLDGKGNLGRKRDLFRAYERNKKDELDEAREARRYYHDKQWTDAERKRLRTRGQQDTVRNRIKRKIDVLVGVEQRMRRDPKAYPVNPGDEKSADVATAGMRFVTHQNRWEQVASRSARAGFVAGVGACFIGIEPDHRGVNEVRVRYVPEDRFFYDPRSVHPDFSDARYLGEHLWMDIEDAVAENPDKEKELRAMVDSQGSALTTATVEEDYAHLWGDFERQRVRIVVMYEKRPMGDGRQGWYYCKFSGDVEIEASWSTYLDAEGKPDHPYEAWTCYIDDKAQRYGVVRTMKSVQDEINHRASKVLWRLSTRQMHVREGVVADVDEMRRQMARPDGVVVHQSPKWGEDVGTIDQGQQIQGEADLLNLAISEIENFGPNPGLEGKGGGVADQSGRAILAQRDSGMLELSPVFDHLRDWKLRCYRKMWSRIRQAWTGERWIRITDDPRAPQFIGVNQFGLGPDGSLTAQNVIAQIDVDIIMDEGPDTITMQEELMQTFAQLGEAAAGPLGHVLIELSNAPQKERLIEMLSKATAPAPEMVAMQQRMAEIEAALKEAQIAKTHAEVEAKRIEAVVKLQEAQMPPPLVQQVFPMPFEDMSMAGGQQTGPPPGFDMQPPKMGGMHQIDPGMMDQAEYPPPFDPASIPFESQAPTA